MALPLAELSKRERQRFAVAVLTEREVVPCAAAAFAGMSPDTAREWARRQVDGLDIRDAPRSGRPRDYGQDAESRFIAFYCQSTPFEDAGRWTLRWAERELGDHPETIGCSPSRSTMQRMLSGHHLRPHRNRYFLQITDPDFFPKAERIIALYKSPPKNLFCFDECPGIQILQRIVPDLRPRDDGSIRQWWREFEYIRNGTTDLFAFLEVRTGNMSVSCHPDHKKATFLAQFGEHAGALPEDEPIHYVMDNLDSHCCYEFCMAVAELSGVTCPSRKRLGSRQERREWLQREDKRVVIHFTPFHGSWLNQAEICFNLIGHACLRDSYSCPDQIHAAILAFVAKWNSDWAHPFHWRYDGDGLHKKAVERFTAALTHSAGKMTLQYMAKSCALMVNLITDYYHEVPAECWRRYIDALIANEQQLWQLVRTSTQPIVKRRTENALRAALEAVTDPKNVAKAA